MSTGCIWSDAGTFTVWLCALTTVEVLKTPATAEGLVGLPLPHPMTYTAPTTIGNAFRASSTKVRLCTVTILPRCRPSTRIGFGRVVQGGAESSPHRSWRGCITNIASPHDILAEHNRADRLGRLYAYAVKISDASTTFLLPLK